MGQTASEKVLIMNGQTRHDFDILLDILLKERSGHILTLEGQLRSGDPCMKAQGIQK